MSSNSDPLVEVSPGTLIQINPDTLEAYVKAASVATGLPVAETYLNAVAEHFAVAARMADRVLSFSLPDEAGVAPVFVP